MIWCSVLDLIIKLQWQGKLPQRYLTIDVQIIGTLDKNLCNRHHDCVLHTAADIRLVFI